MDVKELYVAPISAKDASGGVKQWHYSGRICNNSCLHLGVFYKKVLCGVMSFGPSMDKSKIIGLVADTKWNGFLELNRMAFSDALPKNSESRCLAVALRIIKKNYPHIEWVISFADATQCGHGTIYQACGFTLTGIKENNQIWEAPDGSRWSRLSLTQPNYLETRKLAQKYNIELNGHSLKPFENAGFKCLDGYMIRYIKFLNPQARERLTVPEIPYSKIKELHAAMYKGQTLE